DLKPSTPFCRRHLLAPQTKFAGPFACFDEVRRSTGAFLFTRRRFLDISIRTSIANMNSDAATKKFAARNSGPAPYNFSILNTAPSVMYAKSASTQTPPDNKR